MVRILLAAFLIGHGFVNIMVHAGPTDPDKPPPFDPNRSWALNAAHVAVRPARNIAIMLAWATGGFFAIAGVSLMFGFEAWLSIALVGAVIGLALKVLYFNPWLSLGVAIDVWILWAALAEWPPSLL